MPLTPATTDKFTKVGNPGTATTMSAPGYTDGVSNAMQVGSTTNWNTDTKVVYAVDRAQIVNGVEERIAGSYNEFEGIVTGANTISNVVRRFGTPQNYPAGSLTRVYIPVAATRENDMVEGLAQDHNLKGNHKSLTDDNNNEWLERGQVASAVNQVKVTNAITATAPRLDASGDDAAVDIYMGGKGTGVAHAENPELMSNFVASGGVVAISAGLITTMSDIVYYIAGKRYKKTSIANKTHTASKDVYVDINAAGTLTYSEVANGAASPALVAGNIRLAKVVTAAATITSITQTGRDSLRNKIRPAGSVADANSTPNFWVGSMNSITLDTTSQIAATVSLPTFDKKMAVEINAIFEINYVNVAFEAYAAIAVAGANVAQNYHNSVTGDFFQCLSIPVIIETDGGVDITFRAGRTTGSGGNLVNRSRYTVKVLGAA